MGKLNKNKWANIEYEFSVGATNYQFVILLYDFYLDFQRNIETTARKVCDKSTRE